MQIIDRPLDGLVVFENKRFSDERGFFEEFYNEIRFQESGAKVNFVQVNHSQSRPNVLRGLHAQEGQSKLVGVLRGRVWDVAVDVRPESPTYGQHFGLELSAENRRLLWIPSGFAHGFCVLGDEAADLVYLVNAPWNPKLERTIRWNDPTLKIPWPLSQQPIVSDKDQTQGEAFRATV